MRNGKWNPKSLFVIIGIASVAHLYSCNKSDVNDQGSTFNPVGEWVYPMTGIEDSMLFNFSMKILSGDSVQFIGYLDGNQLDSTKGTWKYQSDTIYVSLPLCVDVGIESTDTAIGSTLGPINSCRSQLKFINNDDVILNIESKKKFKRK